MPTIGVNYRVKVPIVKNTSFRRKAVSFGDGYEQRAFEGINYKSESMEVVFFCNGTTEKNALESVINNAGGVVPITWQAPGDSISKNWLFTNPRYEFISATFGQLTVNVELVNEP